MMNFEKISEDKLLRTRPPFAKVSLAKVSTNKVFIKTAKLFPSSQVASKIFNCCLIPKNEPNPNKPVPNSIFEFDSRFRKISYYIHIQYSILLKQEFFRTISSAHIAVCKL